MFGRLMTMIAGRALARQVGGAVAGPAGMVVGALLPTVMRRLGPGGMVAAAVLGYAFEKQRKKARAAGPTSPIDAI
ncbi:MAG: hypothetical protein ACRYG4_11460 [Janthinobacterium lividum]